VCGEVVAEWVAGWRVCEVSGRDAWLGSSILWSSLPQASTLIKLMAKKQSSSKNNSTVLSLPSLSLPSLSLSFSLSLSLPPSSLLFSTHPPPQHPAECHQPQPAHVVARHPAAAVQAQPHARQAHPGGRISAGWEGDG